MTNMTRSMLSLLLCATALVASTPSEAEDAVLVSSSVERYVAGSVVSDSQTLTLPAGASATLLFRSGDIVRLKGPFEGRLDAVLPAAAPGGVQGLVHALTERGVDASVVGASRGEITLPHTARAGEPVYVEAQRSAIYCVGPKDTLWLRSSSVAGGIVRLRHGRSLREVAWPEGAQRVQWPDDILVEDGDRFEAIDDKGGIAATMIFHRFDPPAASRAWIATALLSGCRSQAEPALRELARDIEKDGGN